MSRSLHPAAVGVRVAGGLGVHHADWAGGGRIGWRNAGRSAERRCGGGGVRRGCIWDIWWRIGGRLHGEHGAASQCIICKAAGSTPLYHPRMSDTDCTQHSERHTPQSGGCRTCVGAAVADGITLHPLVQVLGAGGREPHMSGYPAGTGGPLGPERAEKHPCVKSRNPQFKNMKDAFDCANQRSRCTLVQRRQQRQTGRTHASHAT